MRILRAAGLVCCLGTGILAQSPSASPDLSALMKDVMRFHVSPNQAVVAIWYPFEMMAAVARLENPGATGELVEASAGFMRGYAVFGIQASLRDGEGRQTFLSEAEIGAIASVTDGKGRELRRVTDPLPNLAMMLAMVKAGMRARPDSAHLELVVFDNKDAEGGLILQPTRPGGFALKLRSESGLNALSLDWETPLPSLVGVTRCARCDNALTPGWNFCPICGLAVPKEPETKQTTPRPAPLAAAGGNRDIAPAATSTIPYRPTAAGLTLPRLVREVKPQYTKAAMDKGITGTVVLDCVVEADGQVERCEIARSLDSEFGLDQEATKAARQWRFLPGKKDGVAVPVLVTIELTFTLRAK